MKAFSIEEKDRIIEMCWEDRTPFEAIEFQFGLKPNEVINFMRLNSKPPSFKRWRIRTNGRKTKHIKKGPSDLLRFKCALQKNISLNRISKR
jgi:uncharacterized protein (TIGR03643 family)